METVAKGVMALRKTMGVELQPTLEAVTEAIAKGNTRALKEFGIEAKDKSELLREMTKDWNALGGSAELAGDDVLRSGVSMADTFDDLAGKLGELVVAMAPAIEAFTMLIGLVPQFIGLMEDLTDDVLGIQNKGTPEQQIRAQINELRVEAATKRGMAKPGPYNNLGDDDIKKLLGEASNLERMARDQEASLGRMVDKWGKEAAAKSSHAFVENFKDMLFRGDPRKASKGSGGFQLNAAEAEGFSGFSSLSNKWENDEASARALGEKMGAAFFNYQREHGALDQLGSDARLRTQQGAQFRAESEILGAELAEAMLELAKVMDLNENETMFSKVFGTADELDFHAEAIETLARSFSILQQAAGDAYDTLIKGGDLSMKVFKDIIASGIAAMGKDFFVRGLGELAHAAASLAWGNVPKASVHGKAALMYFGGAAAAGVAANAMGYGSGGGASAGVGTAPSVTRGSMDRDRDLAPVNIYVGSEWAGLSSIQQSQAIQRAIRIGRGNGSTHVRRG